MGRVESSLESPVRSLTLLETQHASGYHVTCAEKSHVQYVKKYVYTQEYVLW
jgi:hypothetical protein